MVDRQKLINEYWTLEAQYITNEAAVSALQQAVVQAEKKSREISVRQAAVRELARAYHGLDPSADEYRPK